MKSEEKKLNSTQEEIKKEVKPEEQNGVKLDDEQMEQVAAGFIPPYPPG